MKRAGPIDVLGLSAIAGDHLQAAWIRTNGEEILKPGKSLVLPLADASTETVDNAAAAALDQLGHPDLIGFEGHGTETDGRLLAEAADTPVAWDFRGMDLEMGGNGRLVPAFVAHAVAYASTREPLAIWHLDGHGPLYWAAPSAGPPQEPGGAAATEPGPTPALAGFGSAANGTVDDRAAEAFLSGAHYLRVPPALAAPDLDERLLDTVSGLEAESRLATIRAILALGLASALEAMPGRTNRLLLSGRGRDDPALRSVLGAAIGFEPEPVEAIGLDGDCFDALAVAYLAARVARGLPTSAPATTGVSAAIGGGQIARPGRG